MTATDLLQELQQLDVHLSAQAGRLVIDAPVGVVAPDRLDLIRRYKAELLELVTSGPCWARQAATLIAGVDDSVLRVGLRDAFEERASICEYDGGLSRDEAERTGLDEVRAILATWHGETRP